MLQDGGNDSILHFIDLPPTGCKGCSCTSTALVHYSWGLRVVRLVRESCDSLMYEVRSIQCFR